MTSPFPDSAPPPTILVVDDDPDGRELLTRFLERDGYRVVAAGDGHQAVELFTRLQPDAVLMDVIMPGMDGYEATRRIRDLGGERVVPVIFLTALDQERELSRCLECGGDDFLSKPYRRGILKARLDSWLRKSAMAEQLRRHRDRLAFERRTIERVMERIRQSERFNPHGLHYLMAPVESTAGDLLLAAARPDGVRHILMGDFTGHGFTSALAAPTVSDIFYGMTERGFALEHLLREMNRQLCNRLPAGMYLAAVGVELDPEGGVAWVWNGGIPDVLLFRQGGLAGRVPSTHLPLGIIEEFDPLGAWLAVGEGDRILAFSDGVSELQVGGRMVGVEGVIPLFARMIAEDRGVPWLEEQLRELCGGEPPHDDLTVVEIRCGDGVVPPLPVPSLSPEGQPPFPTPGPELAVAWSMAFVLGPEPLQSPNLLPHMGELLGQLPRLDPYYPPLFTLLRALVADLVAIHGGGGVRVGAAPVNHLGVLQHSGEVRQGWRMGLEVAVWERVGRWEGVMFQVGEEEGDGAHTCWHPSHHLLERLQRLGARWSWGEGGRPPRLRVWYPLPGGR